MGGGAATGSGAAGAGGAGAAAGVEADGTEGSGVGLSIALTYPFTVGKTCPCENVGSLDNSSAVADGNTLAALAAALAAGAATSSTSPGNPKLEGVSIAGADACRTGGPILRAIPASVNGFCSIGPAAAAVLLIAACLAAS